MLLPSRSGEHPWGPQSASRSGGGGAVASNTALTGRGTFQCKSDPPSLSAGSRTPTPLPLPQLVAHARANRHLRPLAVSKGDAGGLGGRACELRFGGVDRQPTATTVAATGHEPAVASRWAGAGGTGGGKRCPCAASWGRAPRCPPQCRRRRRRRPWLQPQHTWHRSSQPCSRLPTRRQRSRSPC